MCRAQSYATSSWSSPYELQPPRRSGSRPPSSATLYTPTRGRNCRSQSAKPGVQREGSGQLYTLVQQRPHNTTRENPVCVPKTSRLWWPRDPGCAMGRPERRHMKSWPKALPPLAPCIHTTLPWNGPIPGPEQKRRPCCAVEALDCLRQRAARATKLLVVPEPHTPSPPAPWCAQQS